MSTKYLTIDDIMADLEIVRSNAYTVMHSKGFPLEPRIRGCSKGLRVLAANYETWKKKNKVGQVREGT